MIGTEIKEFGQVINNDKLMVVHVNLPQGKKIAPHDHQGQDIFFSVVKGQVKATLNNSEEHTLSRAPCCTSAVKPSSASKPSSTANSSSTSSTSKLPSPYGEYAQ